MGMIFCRHDWHKIRMIDEYQDYSGFMVGVFECQCSKCGKIKLRKYW